jgi:hypothetical protein
MRVKLAELSGLALTGGLSSGDLNMIAPGGAASARRRRKAMALAPMPAWTHWRLYVMSYERGLSPQAVDVICSIADQIGLAIDNASVCASVVRSIWHIERSRT